MLRAIIIDDEQKGIDTLKMLVELFVPDLKIVAETTRPEKALSVIESFKPEIVFLDINMPEMNGFDVLKNLQWREFALVFTTAHQEYALRALKENALDYLLKPIDHEELQATVTKVKNIVEENRSLQFNYNQTLALIDLKTKKKLLINSKSGAEYVNLNEIVYLESDSNYTRIFLESGNMITSPRTLKDFEVDLCTGDRHFMRIHHSYIVNLHKVARYMKATEDIILVNDQKVPVAKSRKDLFLEWLEL